MGTPPRRRSHRGKQNKRRNEARVGHLGEKRHVEGQDYERIEGARATRNGGRGRNPWNGYELASPVAPRPNHTDARAPDLPSRKANKACREGKAIITHSTFALSRQVAVEERWLGGSQRQGRRSGGLVSVRRLEMPNMEAIGQ